MAYNYFACEEEISICMCYGETWWHSVRPTLVRCPLWIGCFCSQCKMPELFP